MSTTFPGASYDAWKTTEPAVECSRCGSDEHAACEPTCVYCQRPSVIESALGLDDDDHTPRPEHRCEECHEGFERTARRNRRLAQEGWI